MRAVATDVVTQRGLCMFVYLSVGHITESYKTAILIEMPFGAYTCEPKKTSIRWGRSAHLRHLANRMELPVRLSLPLLYQLVVDRVCRGKSQCACAPGQLQN